MLVGYDSHQITCFISISGICNLFALPQRSLGESRSITNLVMVLQSIISSCSSQGLQFVELHSTINPGLSLGDYHARPGVEQNLPAGYVALAYI